MSTNLDNEQKLVFEKYLNKENVFLTGPGGTGKTFLIKTIANHAKEAGAAFQVCALTGCAAVVLECSAKTIHAWAGIGLAQGKSEDIINRVIKSKHRRANWNKVQLLIIDEVSMLSAKLLYILDKIARIIKRNPQPFGGIQVIFSGDFYQLPPISHEDDEESAAFCFESPIWEQIFKNNHITLKTIYRQDDKDFIKALNKLRIGKLTPKTCELFRECMNHKDETEIRPTMILPRRKDVEKINSFELDKLDSQSKVYNLKPYEMQNLSKTDQEKYHSVSKEDYEFEFKNLKDNILAEETLELKVGAQVLCIANIEMEGPYPIVNGSQGIITEFIGGFPRIKFNNGEVKVIGNHVWESEKVRGVALSQIPLIHAWAITIHKAQGMSLDKATIDVGSGIFECGQTYVALSRVRNKEGLFLLNFAPDKIKVNKKVKKFYND